MLPQWNAKEKNTSISCCLQSWAIWKSTELIHTVNSDKKTTKQPETWFFPPKFFPARKDSKNTDVSTQTLSFKSQLHHLLIDWP